MSRWGQGCGLPVLRLVYRLVCEMHSGKRLQQRSRLLSLEWELVGSWARVVDGAWGRCKIGVL